jgi:hypothetical protein
MQQSKLLDSMGTAEMEREVQKQVLTVAKKASASLKEDSGIQTSMNDAEMKEYVELVIKELQSKNLK